MVYHRTSENILLWILTQCILDIIDALICQENKAAFDGFPGFCINLLVYKVGKQHYRTHDCREYKSLSAHCKKLCMASVQVANYNMAPG